jgi:hypothetical protein
MRKFKQVLSAVIAFVMMFAALPVAPAAAAGGDIQFTHYSDQANSPTQVATNVIDVSGSYAGISFSTLRIKVESLLNDNTTRETVTENDGLVPLQIGTNGFLFSNVTIRPGKNKITVYGYSSGTSVVVEKSAYVYYANAPSIYDIQLQDGRTVRADRPTLVTTSTLTLMFKAPNATSVTVQGVNAIQGGADTFLISNIPLNVGLNTITFVASNGTQTYTITRDIVRYGGTPTAAGVSIINPSGNPTATSLDGNPTVGPNGSDLSGYIEGYLFAERKSGLSNTYLPTVDVRLQDVPQQGNLPSFTVDRTTTVTKVEDISVTGAVYDYVMYRFRTSTTAGDYFTVTTNGEYEVQITGSHGTDSIAQVLTFKYRSANSPIIDSVMLANNVRHVSGNEYTYGSVSELTNNQKFFEAPIWIAVNARNFDPKTDQAKLETFVNDNPVGSPTFTYENSSGSNYYTSNGQLLFKITNMPTGEQTLKVTISRTAGGTTQHDSKEIDLTFNPTPFIEITSHTDGQTFDDASQLTVIRGKLYNFNLNPGSADRNSLKLTFNGVVANITNINAADNTFEFDTTGVTGMTLVLGTNTIQVSGTAGGVPVSTTITLFLFAKDTPTIVSMIPVPTGETQDTDRQINNTGTDQYSTGLKRVDVLFEVGNADTITVSTDGIRNNIITRNGTTWSPDPDDENPLTVTVETIGGRQMFRIHQIVLPETGTKSVTITVTKGVSTAYRSIAIERIRQPYVILSPKLPEEQVINRNFLKVSIQAEGADRIVLGKQEMVKGNEDIFRLDYYDLKTGTNTIKFTVYVGENKYDGQFTVNYAAKPEVGAEFKTTIPKSGKLNNLFEGNLTIDFGKNTMLRKPTNKELVNVPQVELFDSQYIYIGIADPKDGRTVKRYNRVGELDNGAPADGTMADVYPNDFARGTLQRGIANFIFASPLFWIDAGYFVENSNTYETVDGMHPYVQGDEFYTRGLQQYSKWMEPTERGTITLKYDPGIRNEATKLLSVWKFSNNTWKNVGGVVNTSRKTITATFDGFGYYAVLSLRYGYPDIIGSYARDHAETMYAKGIMYPKPDSSTFGLNEPITRGEFATMLVRMLDLPLNYSNNLQENYFDDVPIGYVTGTLWDYRYIETAARAGIIRGLGTRSFAPNVNLTREQAAIMIARALNLKLSGDVDKDRDSLAKVFVDAGQIDQHAVTSVQAIYKKGFIQGRPIDVEGAKKQQFAFNPKANLTRAEMAVIAYKIMQDLKKL